MLRERRPAFYDGAFAFRTTEAIENRQLDSINVAAARSNAPARVWFHTFSVTVGESRSPSLRRWHVTVTPGGTHTHYEYLMDEDINDAQKILPSSVPRVNTPSSVSAWQRVQISGREGITPIMAAVTHDPPSLHVSQVAKLKTPATAGGALPDVRKFAPFFFFKRKKPGFF